MAKKSMIVMNCNPFTLGHQYLIEQASKESEEVIIFIVEEDKSVFPFNIRYKLVKEGCAHLKNVKVIPGTKYIISSATFPNFSSFVRAYFLFFKSLFKKFFILFIIFDFP